MSRLTHCNSLPCGVYSSPASKGCIQLVAARASSGRPLYLLDVQSSSINVNGYRDAGHATAQLSLDDLLALDGLIRGLAIEATESIDAEAARQIDLVLA